MPVQITLVRNILGITENTTLTKLISKLICELQRLIYILFIMIYFIPMQLRFEWYYFKPLGVQKL